MIINLAPSLGAETTRENKPITLLGVVAGNTPSPGDVAAQTRLMVAVERFKVLAQQDFGKALLVYANEDALARLWDIHKGLWEPVHGQLAWALFFGGAVHTLGEPLAKSVGRLAG